MGMHVNADGTYNNFLILFVYVCGRLDSRSWVLCEHCFLWVLMNRKMIILGSQNKSHPLITPKSIINNLYDCCTLVVSLGLYKSAHNGAKETYVFFNRVPQMQSSVLIINSFNSLSIIMKYIHSSGEWKELIIRAGRGMWNYRLDCEWRLLMNFIHSATARAMMPRVVLLLINTNRNETKYAWYTFSLLGVSSFPRGVFNLGTLFQDPESMKYGDQWAYTSKSCCLLIHWNCCLHTFKTKSQNCINLIVSKSNCTQYCYICWNAGLINLGICLQITPSSGLTS